MSIDGLPPIRDVVARHQLRPRRSLGQNFLHDLNLTARIARAAGNLETGTTIEIGPGPGGLTRALLAEGAREVIAVERDSRCLAALAEIAHAYPGRLTVLEADALGLKIETLGSAPRRIVANLPYNIGTALLVHWLADAHQFQSMTLMLQKEVVDRLIARPRTKDYGRLSVLVQWLTEARRMFDVPPRAFVPPPKVTSSVVRLVPRARPLFPAKAEILERVTRAAFGQRRKMLRQSLRTLSSEPEALLATCAIAPTARAEELDVEQFCAIAWAIENGALTRE
jgi:16S rRNA (adenine1518-N6/adenine1519-N6)-dimethyltransferase